MAYGELTPCASARVYDVQVKFNLENKVVDTYPKAEYDRNGINPKPTSEEMLQIRQEV